MSFCSSVFPFIHTHNRHRGNTPYLRECSHFFCGKHAPLRHEQPTNGGGAEASKSQPSFMPQHAITYRASYLGT